MLDWVPITAYLDSAKGDTREAVESRLRRGHWLRGVHARKPEGAKELWINLPAVNDWAAGKSPAHQHGSAK